MSAILSVDYFCLVSYISSDGHFSEIYLDYLVTPLQSLLDVIYYRVTALDSCRVTEISSDCLY